jgi:hypothetical protein
VGRVKDNDEQNLQKVEGRKNDLRRVLSNRCRAIGTCLPYIIKSINSFLGMWSIYMYNSS